MTLGLPGPPRCPRPHPLWEGDTQWGGYPWLDPLTAMLGCTTPSFPVSPRSTVRPRESRSLWPTVSRMVVTLPCLSCLQRAQAQYAEAPRPAPAAQQHGPASVPAALGPRTSSLTTQSQQGHLDTTQERARPTGSSRLLYGRRGHPGHTCFQVILSPSSLKNPLSKPCLGAGRDCSLFWPQDGGQERKLVLCWPWSWRLRKDHLSLPRF